MQPLLQIGRPPARFFGAFAFCTVHLQGQSDDYMVHMFVFDDVQDLVNSKEIVAGNMNVASRMCKGKLRVGQCQSDPGITQINA